jgi:hypothetical protein
MNSSSLDLFVGNVLARKRIRFGDLRRLQRDILPSGLTARGEAEALIALDQAVERADPTWRRYLTRVVTEFVGVDGGSVDQDAAAWLVAVLSCARPKTAAAIVREVLVAADQVDDALLAFAEGSRRRSRPETPTEPVQLGPDGSSDSVVGCLAQCA